MSQLANITVKNGSNVDQVFTAYQPQSGSDAAVWYAKTGATRNTWTSLTSTVRRTTNKASKLKFNVTIPYFDLAGVEVGKIPVGVEMTVPDNCPAATIADAQAYLQNLMASTLIKEMILTASPAV